MKYLAFLFSVLFLGCSTNKNRIEQFIGNWLKDDYNLDADFCHTPHIDYNDFCTQQVIANGKEYFGGRLDNFISGYTIDRIYFLDHKEGEIAFARIQSEVSEDILVLEFLYSERGLVLRDLSLQ